MINYRSYTKKPLQFEVAFLCFKMTINSIAGTYLNFQNNKSINSP